ncbi:MAG: protein kinase, partial [Myxococcota bacterium]|nr:protein kinase [Myxococcota bacterium]
MLLLLCKPGIEDADAKVEAALQACEEVASPQVVGWSDGGTTDDGAMWLVAPWQGSSSFSEYVSRCDGLSPSEAAVLVHQVARAVAAGEAHGIHHHFLGGELVRLMEVEGQGHVAKVYGHGLCGLMAPYSAVRKADPFLGVPDYMAPELCQGKPAAGPADVYALGVLMYEAIRARAPFAPRTSR